MASFGFTPVGGVNPNDLNYHRSCNIRCIRRYELQSTSLPFLPLGFSSESPQLGVMKYFRTRLEELEEINGDLSKIQQRTMGHKSVCGSEGARGSS